MTDEEIGRLLEGAVDEIRRNFELTWKRLDKQLDMLSEQVVLIGQKLDHVADDLATTCSVGSLTREAF